ncbi:MAG: ferredoxin [Candidatus Dormibacteraeota bacterium]|nr:ferredoxin [Candidatus Dormibacteraeota bacterium]
MSRRYLHVDPTLCVGHRLCAEMLPELITLDDFGYPIISPDPWPRQLGSLVRRTVGACPALALAVDGTPGRRARRDEARPGTPSG